MALSNDLISQFVKVTKDEVEVKKEMTVYGTIVEHEGKKYVKLDGSDLLTPISSTASVEADERVTVMIKNHTATVTGNMSSPSASVGAVENIGNKITEFEIVIADKVSTDVFDAQTGRIDELVSDNVLIKERLTASEAAIDNVEADNVTINEKLTAHEASIDSLETHKLSATDADLKYATISDLNATNADIHNLNVDYGDFKVLSTNKFDAIDADITKLDTEKLSASEAELTYANIDFTNIGEAAINQFYAKSGIIKDLVIENGAVISGEIVGVTIKGDLIEGNTIIADKLVVKGSDGLYYKLNTDGVTTETEQTEYNSLNGSIITAKSITATKINVSDLVAFDATIGGFNITDSSIYSGAKETVDNTTRGIYLDKEGQFAFGDSLNYLKYFRDTDGSWKLAISAQSIKMGGSSKTLEETIDDLRDEMTNLEVGGRNVLRYTDVLKYSGEWNPWSNSVLELPEGEYLKITPTTGDTSSGAYPPKKSTLEEGEEYTISFDAYADAALTLNYFHIVADSENTPLTISIPISTTPRRYIQTIVTANSYTNCSIMVGYQDSSGATTPFYIKNLKLEKGNKATDWTPAPEDVDEEISNAQSTADANTTRLNNASIDIDSLKATISSLVTGANGESLMTQTDTGWTFSMAEVLASLESTGSSVNEINEDVNNINMLLDALNEDVTNLGAYTDYIHFGVDNGQPCIILGETDSEFKVVITNTDIRFMEGTSVPANISNQALNIGKAVISEELKQGNFVWIARSNGNYGLLWRGE